MTEFYHDTHRNISVYPRTADNLIAQYIPEARPLSACGGRAGLIAVPHTLQNAQTLRWLNYPVAPVMTDRNYDWPIEPGRSPGDHQKVMANFFVIHRRGFNLSDPGSQKTLPALWAADWLMRQQPPGACRTLIIAPLTILETVWTNEIFKTFLSRRSVEILHGSAEKRRQLLAKKPDFQVVNFAGVGVGAHTRKRYELDGFSKDLMEDQAIQIVIVDEADAYCDARTKRHRIARDVFGKRPYLLLQTGTPTSSSPVDAYGLGKLVNNAFNKSFTGFRDETMVKISNFKYVPRADGYEKARKLLIPAIRYRIEDVWKNAPELITHPPRKVQLTADQTRLLADLKRDLQVTLKSGQAVTAINEVAARSKFLQIVLGAIYDARHNYHLIDASPRLAEIEYLVERAEHKCLIFTGLTSIVEIVHKRLAKRWKCGIINGDVSQKERVRLIKDFEKDPEFKVMVMDPQPTAHGINEFVVADTVIWNGPIEKTRLYIQGNRRAHRPGQHHPVHIYQIVATKLEQEIFRRLETNTSLQGALLESIRRGEL